MDYEFNLGEERLEGFKKTLSEDTVEYSIYVVDKATETSSKLAFLRKCLSEINSSKELLKDYIWQRQPFELELVYDESLSTWTLRGSTNFGDSVDDEWLIVYLLVEASKTYPELWIRLYDTDGEFLLIEAANALPKWLRPEIAENRVWIHAGEIRLIPSTTLATRSPSLAEAISFIETSSNLMTRSPNLEKEAFYRIKKYPSAIEDHFHQSLVLLPRKLAYILHCNPSYISSAIEAFYLRDPISLKPIIEGKLEFPPIDMVTTSLRFTKVGYAQIKSQEFPVVPAWSSFMEKANAETFPRAMVGMKLACGFEMLLSDKLHQDKRAVREISILLEDLDNGDDTLPTDADMKTWSQKDEDDSWMNIDYNDFDRELGGKGTNPVGEGFGDKMAEENLKKLVSRFEDFINNDEAGLDGAEVDEDEEDDDDDDDEESETGDVSFDEERFAKMMREMMGMPSDAHENEMKQNMKDVEEELREAGVFGVAKSDQEPEENEDVHIDFNLAKNMLEAFKSQGGLSGPAGNLMGLMGVKLPADDEKDKS